MWRRTLGNLLIVVAALAVHAGVMAALWVYDRYRPAGVTWGPATSEPPRTPVLVAIPTPPEMPGANLGVAGGRGEAVNELDADRPQANPESADLEQALLRRGGGAVVLPSAGQSHAALGPTSPRRAMRPAQADKGTVRGDEPGAAETEGVESADSASAEAGQAGLAGVIGDAGNAESDSDPFSSRYGVEYTPGGSTARGGREHRIVRPRIDLAFMQDMTRMPRPVGLLMRLRTDDQGRPTRVEVVRSSGSEIVDQAVTIAMYASWFGEPMPDEFNFGVVFR